MLPLVHRSSQTTSPFLTIQDPSIHLHDHSLLPESPFLFAPTSLSRQKTRYAWRKLDHEERNFRTKKAMSLTLVIQIGML